MKKGFTLVEVLSVLVIISIFTTITIISVNYSINRSRERAYSENIEKIKASFHGWALENLENLPKGDEIFFYDFDLLFSEGIIEGEIIDPRTNEPMSGCIMFSYNENTSQYVIKYDEDECKLTSDDYLPKISVDSEAYEEIEVNTSYKLPTEISAINYRGETIRVVGPLIFDNNSNEYVRNIDTSIVTTGGAPDYIIEYSATDESLGLTSTKQIELKIIDKTPPIITVLGSNRSQTVTYNVNDDFQIPVATVTDNSCGVDGTDVTVNDCDNTLDYSVTSNLISDVPGDYNIVYTATDYLGNTRNLTLNVVIEPADPPSIPTFEVVNEPSQTLYTGSWTNQNVSFINIHSEASGVPVDYYQYSIGCTSNWLTVFGNSFTRSTEMDNDICIRAVDVLGNHSFSSSPTRVRIDKTRPTIFYSPSSTTSWQNTSLSVSVAVNDELSGIYSVRRRLSIDNGATYGNWISSSGSFNQTLSSSGERRIQTEACDRAGNCRTSTSGTYRLDFIIPSISYSPSFNSTWSQSQSTLLSGEPGISGEASFTYVWSAASSGVSDDSIRFNHNNGSTRTLSTATGNRYLWARMCDNAGNCSTQVSGVFRLDNTDPFFGTLSCEYVSHLSSISINQNPADLHAGVSRNCVVYEGNNICASGSGPIRIFAPNPMPSIYLSHRYIEDNAGNTATSGAVNCPVSPFM